MINELNAINELIMNWRLSEAEVALNRLKPKAKADRRYTQHLKAILKFHTGDIRAARTMLEGAIEDFGANVNLFRDLMVCSYHLQDTSSFREQMNQLEKLLVECEPQLSNRSLVQCEIVIGKFMELEARLAPARMFYERAFQRSEDPQVKLRAQFQLARWLAIYQPGAELSAHYRDLIGISPSKISHDLGMELIHTLMAMELRLVGYEHARLRVEHLPANCSPLDRRLMTFDLLEGCLMLDYPIEPSVLEKLEQFQDLDPYEQLLSQLVKGELDALQRRDQLTRLATEFPWASYLRLLCYCANHEPQSTARAELNRKIQLIVLSLDPPSQILWNNRLKFSLQTPEIRVDLCSRTRSLSVHGKSVDLSKKKIGLQLLEKLQEQPTISVDQAIENLWQSTFSPEHYHRLRMSVHRLNTLIHETTGIGKLIEVDSQNVRLRPEIKLTTTDIKANLLGWN